MSTITVSWSLKVSKEVTYQDLANALLRTYIYNYSKVPSVSDLEKFAETKDYLDYKSDFIEELFPCEINELSFETNIMDLYIKDKDKFHECLNLAIKNYVSNSSRDNKYSV